ncbi:IRX7 [Symbiodinium pilosum]|uniref:IRX7 protein n=1 Tax=Symbiodinium pilosum TaxID=2952 RepID=A0A812QK47_SYMPI|nr:IRX7 [Symbiodinium pilosum]
MQCEAEIVLVQDILDEAGFVLDENNPLIYVSGDEASRADGVPYVVVYKKVAIRKTPSTESHVLGAFEAGDQLTLFETDVTGAWRKLHFKLKGGYGSLVEAWVMLRHHKLGTLVQRTDGKSEKEAKVPGNLSGMLLFMNRRQFSSAEDPDKTARASALAAEFGERLMLMEGKDVRRFMPTENRRSFEVVRKPVVAVRTMPHKDALIVTTAEYGRFVDTFGVDDTGEWRKVFCCCTSSGREDVPLPDAPLPAWMLEKHETLGVLLRPADDAMRPVSS